MKKLLLITWVALALASHAQTISTYAGTGTSGYTGDNGQATVAEISTHYIAIDTSGNIFIADNTNNFVRKVNTSGIISTVAGNGTGGYNGDGIAATSAELNSPSALAVDKAGNIYIADGMNARIRKVNVSTGFITTIVGNGTGGYGGDGAAATLAEINFPQGVAIDSLGNIYIADSFNNRIRKVNSSGTIITIAGNGTAGFSGDNGLATSAELNNPVGMCTGLNGYIYFSDGNRVRRVSATDTIKTVAGNGLSGKRKVNNSGIISTIVGTGIGGYNGDGISATTAEINGPVGLYVDGSGDLYIADYGNNRIRKVNSGGIISTVAGNGTAGSTGNTGPATAAELHNPTGVVLDASGNLYISDYTNIEIRKVNNSGIITVFGSGGWGWGFALDASLNMYIAENASNYIGKYNSSGIFISYVAGTGTAGYSGDGGPGYLAEVNNPYGVALDASGNVYIADKFNNRIRKLSNSSAGINELSEDCIVSLYPNPNNGAFNITLQNLNSEHKIEIYDMLGELVYHATLDANRIAINLRNEPNGIYLYRISTEEGSITSAGKFIIQ